MREKSSLLVSDHAINSNLGSILIHHLEFIMFFLNILLDRNAYIKDNNIRNTYLFTESQVLHYISIFNYDEPYRLIPDQQFELRYQSLLLKFL